MSFTAFTVDRRQTLAPGMVLNLVRHTDVHPPVMQAHIDALMPDGVTRHGDQYLVSNSQALTTSPNLELTFEYIRRAQFPTAPSRFQSVFACESRADAQTFGNAPAWGSPGSPIFEIEADYEPFRADMHCLTLEGSISMASYSAHRYWSGLPNDRHLSQGPQAVRPFWELLLRPPVRVLRRIA
jgi:hypothetical protein